MNKRNGLLRLASAALAAALCLTACGAPAASSAPQPTETPAAVGGENVTLGGRDAQGQNGVVSTGRAEATQIGVDVLKAGGNAVDAAVAIGFALGVCEQQSSGIGGGGFMMVRFAKTGEIKFLDFRDESAAAASLDMWTVDENGKLTGHNTDGMGFVRNLHEHGVEVKGKKLVVMGAGGAATAICMQTALDGAAEIAIFNRTGYDFYSNGELTVQKLAEAVPNCKVTIQPLQDKEALAEAVNHCDILVNATTVGMKPLEDQSLIDPSLVRPDLVVADTVYNPRETRMIQEAKAAGCKIAVGGIGMLLWQGVAAFKLYTGKDMPAQEVLEKFFS